MSKKEKVAITVAGRKILPYRNPKVLATSLFLGLVFAALFTSVFTVFADPPASPYTPQETLTPGCAFGSTNCTTVPPISAITGTNLDNVFSGTGLLVRTGAGTYGVANYLTGNQTISLSGDLSGSGATSISGTVTGLQGKPLPSLVTGLLKYNGSAWVFDTTPYLTAVTGASLDNVFTANGLLERTGSGSYQSATPGTDYVVPSATTLSSLTNIGSSLSGLLKASSGSLSAAVSGVDFAPPTSGSSILEGNGSGGFANATAGTDYVVPGVTSLSSLAAVGSLTSGSIGSGFSVGGVTMSLGSDAAGDTYYRNGSGILTRLAVGSDGNVLEVAGGVPAWDPYASPAAGSDTQVQYNNASSLAGAANFVWNAISKMLSLTGTAALDIQASIAPSVLGSNLAAHYEMNDSAGTTTITDSAGSNNGTAQRNTTSLSVAGKINQAISFNGSTDYLTLGTNQIVNTASPFSESFWVDFTATNSGKYQVITRLKGANGEFTFDFGQTGNSALGGYSIYFGFRGHTSTVSADSSAFIDNNLNQWQQYVVTYNGGNISSASSYTVYRNGLALVLTQFGNTVGGSTNANEVGRDGSAGGELHGAMDDLRIYNTNISSAEAVDLYNLGNGTESQLVYPGTNLIDHYKMNDNSSGNAVVADSVGANNGTAQQNTSLLSTTGKINGALTFNGTSDYVNLGTSQLTAGATTVSMWIYETSTPTTGYVADLLAGPGNCEGLQMATKSDGSLQINCRNGGTKLETATSLITTGTWYNVVYVYTGGNTGQSNSYQIYLNGVSQTLPRSGGVSSGVSSLNTIGVDDNATGYFSGRIDDVRIYDSALAANQITEIYNAGNGTEDETVSGASTLYDNVFKGSTSQTGSTTYTLPVNYPSASAGLALASTTGGILSWGSFDAIWNPAGNNLVASTAGNGSITGANNFLAINGAGAAITTGSNNIAIGNQAGGAMTTSSNNNLFGYQAGYNQTPGSYTVPGLIDEYKLNDNAANTAVADSAGSNNGTAQQNTSALHVPGKINGALSFNGTSDYVSASDSGLPMGSSSRTVTAWIKTTSSSGNILLYGQTSGGYDQGAFKMINSGGKLLFLASQFDQLSGNITINDGAWHLVSVTYNGTVVDLYVDGVLDTSSSGLGLSTISNGNFYIGFAGISTPFNGDIDDVRIYNVALLAPEISALYNSGNGTESVLPFDPTIFPAGSNNMFGYQAGYTGAGNNNNFLGYQTGYSNTSGTDDNFLGYQAGYLNTSGSGNNFLGYQAGYSNAASNDNNFFGYQAGYSNTSGTDNNFLGYQSGYNNTSGTDNNFLGNAAGYSNTSGTDNNFLGNIAGYDNTTGHDDNLLGNAAGYSNTTGYDNNFFGYQAGLLNTTGYDNNFLGYQAGSAGNFNSSLLAHYEMNDNAANAKVIDSSIYASNALAQQNTSALHTTGKINGALTFNGSSDYVDMENSPANAIVSAPLTITAWVYLNSITSTNSVVGSPGYGAYDLYISSAGHMDFRNVGNADAGPGTATLPTGTWTHIAVTYDGSNAFYYINGALDSVHPFTSSFLASDHYLGHDFFGSLWLNGSLDDVRIYNTVLSPANIAAIYNSGSGTEGQSLGSATTSHDNNFLGYQTGYSTTTGSNNDFIGYQSGYSNTTGSNNEFLGYQAGYNNIGSGNVFIGPAAGYAETADSNTLFIDNQDRLSSANEQTQSLLYGTFGTPNSNISSNTQSLTINAGQVALPYMPTGGGLVDVQIDPTTGILYQATSSEAFKTNIQPLTDNWDALLDAQPKSYTYKNLGNASIGFLAQDFDSLGLKDLVNYVNGQPYAIDYNLIPVYLVEIAKQQQTDIDSLKLLAGLSTDGTVGDGSVANANGNSLVQLAGTILGSLGITMQNGLASVANLTVDSWTTKIPHITNGIQLTDQVTGQPYCAWFSNGQWEKAPGTCDVVLASLPALAQTVSSSDTADIDGQVQQASQSIQQTAQAVDQVSSDVEQVTGVQNQPAQQAQQAADQAQQSAEDAQQTQHSITQTVSNSQASDVPDLSLDSTTSSGQPSSTADDLGTLLQSAAASVLNGFTRLIGSFFGIMFAGIKMHF